MGFGDRLDVGHLGGERAQGWCSGFQQVFRVAGSWFCLEHSFPKREEKAQAWHTPSFYSGLCSYVTYSERLPLAILSKMIVRFSVVFYYNLVFLSQALEIWRLSV